MSSEWLSTAASAAALAGYKCKKLQFGHKLTANDTYKTAIITKRWYYTAAHRLNVNVLLSNITFLYFFAVLDVLFAFNLCLNRSFLHLYLQFYYNVWWKHLFGVLRCMEAKRGLYEKKIFGDLRHLKYGYGGEWWKYHGLSTKQMKKYWRWLRQKE